MSEPEEADLRPEDQARGVAHRKRVRGVPRQPVDAEGLYTRGRAHPDGLMWPTEGFEASQFSPAGEVTAFANLFQAVRRRWRRASPLTRLAVGAAVVVVVVVISVFSRGNGSGLPSPVPRGATLVSIRSINHRTFRIYASATPGTGNKVVVSYEVLMNGAVIGAASGPIQLLIQNGHVFPSQSVSVESDYVGQVTEPAVSFIRLMAGGQVLDSMTPVSYEGIRFVVLAAIDGPPATAVEELNSKGQVVTQAAVVPPQP